MRNTPGLTVIPLVLAAASGTAMAQSQETPTALREVVVTATKHESTVQTTPVSVTAVSGEEIAERGIPELSSLLRSVPGVSMRNSGPGQTEFEMRGVASTGGNSPTVGFYLDETPLTAPAASNNGKVVIDPNLYDLSRVEVLRGPQGTLYGSGSMGGTIKIVPNEPDVAGFDSSVQLIGGSTQGGEFNHAENAMVNLPFGDGAAALRIVGSNAHTSGWIDRVVVADGQFPVESPDRLVRGDVRAADVAKRYKDVNDADLRAARASLLWNVTDRLSITPSFMYQKIEMGGLSNIDSDPGADAHYQPFDSPEPFSDRVTLGSIKVEYESESYSIVATASDWDRDQVLRHDAAESWQWGLGLPSVYPDQGGIGAGPGVENDKSKQTSAELRVASAGEGRLRWLFGYFHQDFESQWNVDLPAEAAAPVFGTNNLYSQIVPTNIKQQAVFGDVSLELSDKWTANAGLRWYSYDNKVTTDVSGAVSPTGSDEVAHFETSEEDDGINPKLTLSYAASDNVLLYATAAKGFRPGGGTGPVPTSGPIGDACELDLQSIYGTTEFVPSPVSYGSDEVWSFEIGEKFRSPGSRVTLNSAVYFAQWDDVQQNIPLPCGYNFQENVGNAEVYGAELELQAALTDSLVLSANAAYTHAELVESFVQNVGINEGTPVQNVPEWTTSAALTYRRGLGDRLSFMARAEAEYVGSRTDSTYEINTLPSYSLAHLRTGVEGDTWSAILFVRNLLDERARLNNVTNIVINMPTYDRITVAQPRTYGIELSFRFGQ